MAECHPVGFQWVMEAKERGAKVIHVDPRFTRTSATGRPPRADPRRHRHRVPRRDRQLHPRARALVPGVRDAPTRTRRRSSTRTSRTPRTSTASSRASTPRRCSYDTATLAVRGHGGQVARRASARRARRASRRTARTAASASRRGEPPAVDHTLQHPRCVFQLLKQALPALHAGDGRGDLRHPARTPSSRSPRRSARTPAASARRRSCYSVGWTQHTVGVQYIRTAAIIQLLLGNIGRPGGGILALRGHASIQGSTDIPTLYNILPGYLPMPHPHGHQDRRDVRRAELARRPASGDTPTPTSPAC